MRAEHGADIQMAEGSLIATTITPRDRLRSVDPGRRGPRGGDGGVHRTWRGLTATLPGLRGRRG